MPCYSLFALSNIQDNEVCLVVYLDVTVNGERVAFNSSKVQLILVSNVSFRESWRNLKNCCSSQNDSCQTE